MAQYGFYVDLNACIGCKACQIACKDRADNELGINWRRVIEYGGGEWRQEGAAWVPDLFVYNVPTACHHCSNPPCLPVCPTAAIVKDDNGIVTINVDQCIGCHYCEWACPWGAPHFYEDRGVVEKCDFCKDIVDAGGNPACVEACPMRAMDWGDIDALRERYPEAVFPVQPLAGPEDFEPNALYKAHAWAEGREGAILNEEEI
ncbi:MAG: dimethylsulfoxide reductase subunit B [Anaerolineae bacterium]|nr:dimethylsulfoxide reductase subunit B [Anaerolineae bacterium]